jgi:hypothetical protein
MVQGPFEEGMSNIQGSLEEDIDEAGNRKQAESTSDIIFQPWDKNLLDSVKKTEKVRYCTLQTALFIC